MGGLCTFLRTHLRGESHALDLLDLLSLTAASDFLNRLYVSAKE